MSEFTTYLFNNKKQVIATMAPDDVVVSDQTMEINSTITHVLECSYTNEVENAQYFGMKDVDDPDTFLMYKIDNVILSEHTFTLHGTHILFDDLLGRGGIIKDRRPTNESIRSILPDILVGTGWTVGNVYSNNVGTSNYYDENKLDAFWDFLKKWNVEFVPEMTFVNGNLVDKKIHIYNEIGVLESELDNDNGKWYEYGDKLISVEKETKNSGIYTAFYGRGRGVEIDNPDADPEAEPSYGRKLTFEDVEWKVANGDPVDKPLGQDFVEIPKATQLYGYEDGTARYSLVEFNDIELAEELLEATYLHASEQSRPLVHYKTTVVDKSRAVLGEVVRIVRTDMNIRYKTRIFKLTRDFKNKAIKSFEFGDKLIYSRAERTKMLKDEIKESGGEVSEDQIIPIVQGQLANYPTNSQLNDRLVNYPTNSQLDNKLANYATKQYVNDAVDNIEVPTGDSMAVVRHGNLADTPRPPDVPAVYWIGRTAPINFAEGDLWTGGTV